MVEALLALQLVVLGFGFPYIFARDRLFGIFFFFLFVYAIPAEIGYFYFSELSVLIRAYFEPNAWYPAATSVLLSTLLFVLLFAVLRNRFLAAIPFRLEISPSKNKAPRAWIAIVGLLAIACYQALYLVANYSNISWFTAQAEASLSSDPAYFLFVFLLKISVAITITLYVLVRMKSSLIDISYLRPMFLVFFVLFVIVGVRLGNRTDLLAFALGVATFESYRMSFNLKRVAIALFAAAALAVTLTMVESLRYEDGRPEMDLVAAVMVQDYYPPAHMLFASVAHGIVDPSEVILSNFSNSLVMMDYPLLQNVITDVFRPGVATRSAGYAFYVLTEGYMFAGTFGFLYNATVLMLGLSLWRRLAISNSREFNLFLLALMGCMLVNLVRTQTAYFIKYLYMFVTPGVFLYLCLTGMRVRVRALVSWRRTPGEFVGLAGRGN